MVHVVRALPPALEAFARDEPEQDVDMINPLLNSRELQRLSVCRIPFLGAAYPSAAYLWSSIAHRLQMRSTCSAEPPPPQSGAHALVSHAAV